MMGSEFHEVPFTIQQMHLLCRALESFQPTSEVDHFLQAETLDMLRASITKPLDISKLVDQELKRRNGES